MIDGPSGARAAHVPRDWMFSGAWRTWLPAVGVVAIAVGLRLVDAGTRINEDEGYSWLVSTAPSATSFLSRLAQYENTPPLFYLLLEPLKPNSPVRLRIPSIVGGSAAVAVVIVWLRLVLGRTAPALLGGLALAVSPLSVSYADYSRGFMLVEFELLLALMALERLATQEDRRWAWLYCIAGTCAMYTEYYAGIFLLPALVLAVWSRPGRRLFLCLVGCAPFVAFLPWLPELVRQLRDAGMTKKGLPGKGLHWGGIAVTLSALPFGRHGSAAPGLRLAEAIVVGTLLVAGIGAALRPRAPGLARAVAFELATTLALFIVVSVVKLNLFEVRYSTMFIPLAIFLLILLVAPYLQRGVLVGTCALVLLGIGAAIGIFRLGRQYEPDTQAVVELVRKAGYRTIQTNSSIVAFYGRGLDVILDRPFGLGRGRPQCATCVVIDDARFGGVRPGSGPEHAFGPIVVRLPHR